MEQSWKKQKGLPKIWMEENKKLHEQSSKFLDAFYKGRTVAPGIRLDIGEATGGNFTLKSEETEEIESSEEELTRTDIGTFTKTDRTPK